MNKIKGILITGLLLLSMLFVIAPVSAGTIHVYPGDDVRDKILSAASGDTVYVHAGTYTINNHTFIQNKSLTIIGDGSSNTIINFIPGSTPRLYFQLNSGTSDINVNVSGITFKGDSTSVPTILLQLKNTLQGYTMTASVKDCIFDRASWECLRIEADSNNSPLIVTIENCEFKNATNNGAAGIHTYGYSNVNIFNCLVHDNYYGMRFEGNTQATVQSCTIDKNSYTGIDYATAGAEGSVKDSIITNNTVYGILKSGGSGTVTATYNNVWNNGTDYSGTTAGVGSISQNPSYATGRLGDYYLSQSSPAVDKGSASAASLGLDKMTTRTDERWDLGRVDMGYHYPSNWLGKRGLPIDFILKILQKNKNK